MEAAVVDGGRGRWRRLFRKLRDAVGFRRRSSINSTTTPSKPTSQEPMAEPLHPSVAVDTTTPADPLNSPDSVVDSRPLAASFTIMYGPLIADDSIDAGDNPEPLRPMLSSRPGLSEERAQRLFEKYGIKFEPRPAGKENDRTHDLRRVEKKIRVRIHWACEECGTNFGNAKTCSQCGHRRCRDCHRSPAKRVREVLQEARQQQRQQERAPRASGEQLPVTEPTHTKVTGNNNDPPASSISQPADADQGPIAAEEVTDTTQSQYVMQRPSAGAQTLLRPRVQLVRRICHECNTYFDPALPAKCRTCDHRPCKLCLHETHAPTMQEARVDEQQPSPPPHKVYATVQRVYKKPRQRVRWTCEQCNALFVNRERCEECGHRRCEECIRSPPRRIPRPPDPEVLESLEDELLILDEPSSSTQPSTRGSS